MPAPADPPSISIVMPVLNAERYLDECLAAVRAQHYPQDRIEILLADGGSTDRTAEIAADHDVDRILPNPLKTTEAGLALGVRAATGDLVLFIDSDNILVGDDWLERMVRPLLEDPEVLSTEALRWEYRRADSVVNRWQALFGVNDPVPVYVGNYDRYSYLTGRWTDYPYTSWPRDGWEKVELDPRYVPTMGANGYLARREVFDLVAFGDYLFDADYIYELAQRGHRTIARVDVAVRHYYCDTARQFLRKQRRRVQDYTYFKAQGQRTYPWTSRQRRGLARFVLETVLVLPLLADVARGMRRKPDPAWLFHVPACWMTLAVYGAGAVQGRLRPRPHDRAGWQQ